MQFALCGAHIFNAFCLNMSMLTEFGTRFTWAITKEILFDSRCAFFVGRDDNSFVGFTFHFIDVIDDENR